MLALPSIGCMKKNCGADPYSQVPALLPTCAGTIGAPIAYSMGEPITALVLAGGALTNWALLARIGCMAPWYQLGRGVEALNDTIVSLTAQLDRTKGDLTALQGIEGKLKEITAQKELLEKRDRENITSMQHLSPQLEQERLAAAGLVDHLSSVFKEGQEEATSEEAQIHARDGQIISFKQTTAELHNTVKDLALAIAGLQGSEKREEVDHATATQLLTRVQELIATKQQEETVLAEILQELKTAEKTQKAFEAQKGQLEALEKRLLARRANHEPTNTGRISPPKRTTGQML